MPGCGDDFDLLDYLTSYAWARRSTTSGGPTRSGDYCMHVEIFTPEGPTRAVAEFTLGLTLSLLKKIPTAHLDLKKKIWKKLNMAFKS